MADSSLSIKAETVDLTLTADQQVPHDVSDEIEEIESIAGAEPTVGHQEPSTEDQPSNDTSLKTEIEILKQRVCQLEQENGELFKREAALKNKYIQK